LATVTLVSLWQRPPPSARRCQWSPCSPPEEPSRVARIRRRVATCRYFPADDLMGAIPAIRTVAQVQTYQISNISSSDMTPKIWLELSTRINEMLAQPAIASVVVTHGTNTLAAPEAFCDRRHNQRGGSRNAASSAARDSHSHVRNNGLRTPHLRRLRAWRRLDSIGQLRWRRS
jgi:hypothetical protein